MAKRSPVEGGPSPPRSYELALGGARVHLLGCIKGLTSEGELVSSSIGKIGPDLIGIHIGPEELRGLEAVIDGTLTESELSSYERLYALRVSRYGEVQIPPPSLVQAMRSAREKGIAVVPLDMDDEEYSELYTEHIGGITMMRQSLRFRKVGRTKFDDADAETFCIHWDRVVNRLHGFRDLERERERRIASRILSLSGKGGTHLHVLELERTEGILRFLSGSENPLDKIK